MAAKTQADSPSMISPRKLYLAAGIGEPQHDYAESNSRRHIRESLSHRANIAAFLGSVLLNAFVQPILVVR